jgi:glycerol-3-phosphate cytidylyltransferase
MNKARKGIIAGNFDVIHPGYVAMFNEILDKCEEVYVLLHDDPTIERPEKKKPILSIKERREMLKLILWNPVILSYNTEAELLFLLKSINPDIRFLGDDYIGKPFTGDNLDIPIHYFDRSHGWSTTKFKKLISESYEKSNNS